MIYVIWITIHLILRKYGQAPYGSFDPRDGLYPFSSNGYDALLDYYDSTELLVYCVLIPLIIVLITWKWKSIVLVWKKIWNYNKLIVKSYIVWLILNTIWWAISISYHPTERFFPFTSGGKGDPMFNLAYYDSSEFIVYCIILPLIIFFGIWYLKKRKQ